MTLIDSSAAAEFGGSGLRRFARQEVLQGFGPEGQEKLRHATILCLGAGGLGSPLLMYLAAAGIGRIRLIDPDRVEMSNLSRQLLYTEHDIGRAKVEAAAQRLQQIYPDIIVETHQIRFHAGNAMELGTGVDVIVDGTDNFPTRYLSSDIATWLRVPNVYGAIFRFEGQATVFAPHLGGPCYRCMFPTPPPPGTVPTCGEAGVLGVLPGLVGTMQATEVIKLVAGIGQPLIGRMIHIDTQTMRFRELSLPRDPHCVVCGEKPTILAPVDYDVFCGSCEIPSISPAAFRALLVDPSTDICVLDVRLSWECALQPSSLANHPNDELNKKNRGVRQIVIPWESLPDRAHELDRERLTIVVCTIGERSALAVAWLRKNGFARVRHLRGGLRDFED